MKIYEFIELAKVLGIIGDEVSAELHELYETHCDKEEN